MWCHATIPALAVQVVCLQACGNGPECAWDCGICQVVLELSRSEDVHGPFPLQLGQGHLHHRIGQQQWVQPG